MKILYTLNSGTPGGMEQHVLSLVRGMVNQKHEVHVWCKKGEIASWYKEAGALVTEAIIKYDIDPTYIAALNTYLKANSIDVLHCHELIAVVNGLIAGKIAGTSVKITHTHTPISEWPSVSGIKNVIRFLEIKFYAFMVNKYASVEIALTNTRKLVKVNEGINADKLVVIPNCLTNKLFYSDEDFRLNYNLFIRKRHNIPVEALIFGCVSRLSPEKRQNFLINAFSKLSKNENAYLLLAGGGDLEPELVKMVQNLHLENRVIITGVFPQEDLVKYYGAIDVFVFPSQAEGFGLVLIEALATRLPVIASDLDVLKEVGADTVDYFERNKVEKLAQMMQGYVDYFEKNKQIPRNVEGRNRVLDQYSNETFISNYVALYKKGLK